MLEEIDTKNARHIISESPFSNPKLKPIGHFNLQQSNRGSRRLPF